ncbi:SH3 domain-containing protein [Trametes elegans]|nr:SH3 domain-containing protein [Trametes elegans]
MPVSTPSDPQAAALLAHVLSQTQQNINFLAAHNYITPADAADVLARLSQGPRSSSDAISDSLASSVHNLAIAPARSPSPARRTVPPPPPRNNTKKARAIWAYNEDGREPNDLSFSAGETIEIVDETNTDWWTGKCRGKQGLFPANYVELLDDGRSFASPPPAPSPQPPSAPYGMPVAPGSSYYAPPAGPPLPAYGMQHESEKAGMYQPQPYAPLPPAPVQSPPVQVVQQEQQPPKKNKFGKLGSTMANSAAGGVGFGAGAAIGSGIINSIF